ncbi:myoD family inhibitor isoform 2-T2 [Anomaloglossus baeobatrachus]|uniref:myoD family inhibitor n=1 Tax=Anomaloglossus baeobatrachus TaxID=238106 RepID=UPI003F50D35C
MEQIKLKESINVASESMEFVEPVQLSGQSSLPPPVTQAPRFTNGLQCNPYTDPVFTHCSKTSSKKKVSSQPTLEKQTSQTNHEGSESPYLPPSAEEGQSFVSSPVTQDHHINNGTQCNHYPEAAFTHIPKTSSKKKASSQPSLQKQTSLTSNDGSEPPYLPPGAQEDCCVHCTLALLFCQFFSLCNLLLDVLTCGACSADSAGFCCSCCSMGGCPDCADSCSTDCGIVDACCESADCLEICMECCGLCFSS